MYSSHEKREELDAKFSNDSVPVEIELTHDFM
jgi:hypothetical protein